MAEGTQIPGTPACGEWEALLTDALDGLLQPAEEAQFVAHKAGCAACAALYEEARRGREWLALLSPEPEPPEGLLEKILASTGPGHVSGGLPVPASPNTVPAFVPPVWQQPGFLARMRSGVQPRLLMTAAMAFFSLALTLNMAGVQLTKVRLADLRPRAVRSYMERRLNMASVPIVRYYDHLRIVYEVEEGVRELRGQSDAESNGNQQQEQTPPVTPGESRKVREQEHQETREQIAGNEEPSEHATSNGAHGDFLKTSLLLPASASRSSKFAAQKAGTAEPARKQATPAARTALHERSAQWIA